MKNNSEILNEAQLLIGKFNYYNLRIYNEIKPYVGNRILDAGSGVGNITQFFIDRELIVSIDKNMDNIKFQKERFKGYKNVIICNFDLCEERNISILKNYNVDTICCLNTLEHIKNDVSVLKNFYGIVKSEGNIIIIVPAFPILFGTLDVDHYRRYSKKELKNKILKSGFRIEKIFYMNFLLMFYWFLVGKVFKKEITSELNTASHFDKFYKIVSFWENFIKPPLGLSLVCVAKKVNKSLISTV